MDLLHVFAAKVSGGRYGETICDAHEKADKQCIHYGNSAYRSERAVSKECSDETHVDYIVSKLKQIAQKDRYCKPDYYPGRITGRHINRFITHVVLSLTV